MKQSAFSLISLRTSTTILSNMVVLPVLMTLLVISIRPTVCYGRLLGSEGVVQAKLLELDSFDTIEPGYNIPDVKNTLTGEEVIELPMKSQPFSWTADIIVGGEKFSVLVDTASSGLWVTGSRCLYKDTCMLWEYRGKDRKLHTEFEIRYVSGSIRGDYVQANVELGDIVLHKQVAAVVDDPDPSIAHILGGSQGIWGLDRNKCKKCFARSAFDHWPKNLPRVFMLDLRPGQEKMSIGNIDLKKYESRMHWTNQDQPVGYDEMGEKMYTAKWFTIIESVKVDGVEIPEDFQLGKLGKFDRYGSRGGIAHTDTGGSFMAAPMDIAVWLFRQMGLDYRPKENRYFIADPCPLRSQLPTITITVEGGLDIDVTPLDYISPIPGGRRCYILIDAMSDKLTWEADWVLGMPYLKHVVQVLDFGGNRHGLADAADFD